MAQDSVLFVYEDVVNEDNNNTNKDANKKSEQILANNKKRTRGRKKTKRQQQQQQQQEQPSTNGVTTTTTETTESQNEHQLPLLPSHQEEPEQHQTQQRPGQSMTKKQKKKQISAKLKQPQQQGQPPHPQPQPLQRHEEQHESEADQGQEHAQEHQQKSSAEQEPQQEQQQQQQQPESKVKTKYMHWGTLKRPKSAPPIFDPVTAAKVAEANRAKDAIDELETAPAVYPWIDWNEWNEAYELLFSNSGDRSKLVKGIRKLKMWRVRGRAPLSVESTSDLMETKLREMELAQQRIPTESESQLRLSYSMAITRFINGFSEAMQHGMTRLSVNMLCESIGIPRSVVDIRMSSTHDKLPSLFLLSRTADLALSWIQSTYWEPQRKRLADYDNAIRSIIAVYIDLYQAKAKNNHHKEQAENALKQAKNALRCSINKASLIPVAKAVVQEIISQTITAKQAASGITNMAQLPFVKVNECSKGIMRWYKENGFITLMSVCAKRNRKFMNAFLLELFKVFQEDGSALLKEGKSEAQQREDKLELALLWLRECLNFDSALGKLWSVSLPHELIGERAKETDLLLHARVRLVTTLKSLDLLWDAVSQIMRDCILELHKSHHHDDDDYDSDADDNNYSRRNNKTALFQKIYETIHMRVVNSFGLLRRLQRDHDNTTTTTANNNNNNNNNDANTTTTTTTTDATDVMLSVLEERQEFALRVEIILNKLNALRNRFFENIKQLRSNNYSTDQEFEEILWRFLDSSREEIHAQKKALEELKTHDWELVEDWKPVPFGYTKPHIFKQLELPSFLEKRFLVPKPPQQQHLDAIKENTNNGRINEKKRKIGSIGTSGGGGGGGEQEENIITMHQQLKLSPSAMHNQHNNNNMSTTVEGEQEEEEEEEEAVNDDDDDDMSADNAMTTESTTTTSANKKPRK